MVWLLLTLIALFLLGAARGYPTANEALRFRRLREAQAAWSQATFGPGDPVGPLKHLAEEARTLAGLMRGTPEDFDAELADCLLLLLDATRRAGRSWGDLLAAAEAKHEVDTRRRWNAPVPGEPTRHVRFATLGDVRVGAVYRCCGVDRVAHTMDYARTEVSIAFADGHKLSGDAGNVIQFVAEGVTPRDGPFEVLAPVAEAGDSTAPPTLFGHPVVVESSP